MRALTTALLALALTCPMVGCSSDSGTGDGNVNLDTASGQDGSGSADNGSAESDAATTGDAASPDDAGSTPPDEDTVEPTPEEDTVEPAPNDTVEPIVDDTGAPIVDDTGAPIVDDTGAPIVDDTGGEPTPDDGGPTPVDDIGGEPTPDDVSEPAPDDTTPTPVDDTGTPIEDDAGECIPNCEGKTCGPDDCDGTCGECTPEEWCVNSQCVPLGGCIPNCAGKSCGPDGCDGTCGECAPGDVCSSEGLCGPPGTGTANCIDTYNCVAMCGPDQVCATGCVDLASDEAKAELDLLSVCQEGCPAQDMSCLLDICITELAECAYDTHGVATCLDMFTCLQSCDPTDAVCQFACIDQGSLDAQAKFMAIQLCLQIECPNQDDACVQTVTSFGGACESYVNACFGI
ncbi:MAG: hypothetical protein QF464_11910 [Myxococcota bacterium]|nr:hypothetical protein [Myxococcota bacterium]